MVMMGVSLLFGAGCFALGYFIACSCSNNNKINNNSRFFSWAKAMVINSNPNGMVAAAAHPFTPTPKDIMDQNNKKNKKSNNPSILEIETLADILQDFKMVLVVRNDLKMGKGKIAAQCSHATLGLYKKLLHRAPKGLNRWEMCGQVKVVLKSESEEDLLVLQERARSLKLPTHITIDAGRTQIAPNSRTVMAILGPADMVDDVTGGLKLL